MRRAKLLFFAGTPIGVRRKRGRTGFVTFDRDDVPERAGGGDLDGGLDSSRFVSMRRCVSFLVGVAGFATDPETIRRLRLRQPRFGFRLLDVAGFGRLVACAFTLLRRQM